VSQPLIAIQPRPQSVRGAASSPDDRGPILAGLLVAGAFMGGFGGWAALAPLSSAAVAPGQVRVESHSKIVQHMEGGIIREILIREGDWIARGQLLVRIDDTQAAAKLGALKGQYLGLKALETRLSAERDGRAAITFPPAVDKECLVPPGRMICAAEEKIYSQRRRTLEGQTDILKQRIDQLHSEIDGRRAQIASFESQIRTTRDEIKSVEPLVNMQLLPKPRLSGLERQAASLDGNRGEQLALVAKAEQGIGETQMQIADLVNKQQTEVAGSLRDTQEKLADVEENLRAASDVQHRTDVVAPQSGKIVNLRYFTVGGVVKPGDAILDIVPQNDRLVIYAEVQPLDIEAVRPGLSAEVRLIAYKRRRAPSVNGTVTYVSADRVASERAGQSYYEARVEIDPSSANETSMASKRALRSPQPTSLEAPNPRPGPDLVPSRDPPSQAVEVAAGASLPAPAGSQCIPYSSKTTISLSSAQAHGVACRGADGRWWLVSQQSG
jgi:HlyD family secretion protein